MRTARLEPTDPHPVPGTVERPHFEHHENVNYLLTIKRITGMALLPEGIFPCPQSVEEVLNAAGDRT